MKKPEEGSVSQLSYEQAMQELEQIVTKLESNQGTLEENMALFERGQLLAQRCTDLLEKAELKVKQLNPGGTQEMQS